MVLQNCKIYFFLFISHKEVLTTLFCIDKFDQKLHHKMLYFKKVIFPFLKNFSQYFEKKIMLGKPDLHDIGFSKSVITRNVIEIGDFDQTSTIIIRLQT